MSERYERYYVCGDIEFFLEDCVLTEEDCIDLLHMMLLQATRDFFTFQNPIKAADREIYFTASGLLFDDNYRFYWGEEEYYADFIFDTLGLDKEWIREGLIEKLEKRQKRGISNGEEEE